MSREVVSTRDVLHRGEAKAKASGTTQDELRKIAAERSKATGLGDDASPGGVGYGVGRGAAAGSPPRQPAPAPSKPKGSECTPDSYTNRLLKYVPAEVVALFLTLDALIRSSTQVPLLVYWAVFLFCVAATYGYLWKVGKVRKQPQLLISTVAFVVWVFAIGGPFTHFSWYAPIYGGLLLPIYTFSIALYEA